MKQGRQSRCAQRQSSVGRARGGATRSDGWRASSTQPARIQRRRARRPGPHGKLGKHPRRRFPPKAGPIEAGSGRWCRHVRRGLPRHARGPVAATGRRSGAGGQAGRPHLRPQPGGCALQSPNSAVRRAGPPAAGAGTADELRAAHAAGCREPWLRLQWQPAECDMAVGRWT